MKQKILKFAKRKFKKLFIKYKGFINVGFDNWRGYRFIFDTDDVRKCQNHCLKCPLYLLLKNEKEGIFSAGLYPASQKDGKLFGNQKYLNCKTLEQYKNCYINFLLKETNTKEAIKAELELIKNFRIIFSKESSNLKSLEDNFKKSIVKEAMTKSNKRKRRIIKEVASRLNLLELEKRNKL